MDREKEVYSYRGVGFTGLLAIVFITLKLLGKITWSWVWVLSPLWIPLVVIVGVVLLVTVPVAIYGEIKKRKNNRSKEK